MTTPALPHVPAGTILELSKDQWRNGLCTLFVKVESVHPYLGADGGGEWAWVIGHQRGRDGMPLGRLEVLVRVTALTPHPASAE